MFQNNVRWISAASLCLAALPQIAMAECRAVAGTIDATVVGGEPLNVVGNVSGDLAGATRAVVTGQSDGADGTVKLDLSHDFVTHGRASMKTADTAVWTPVPGKEGVFHMATEYTIKGGTGAFAGASGRLMNDGIADTNLGLLTLRYEGKVCVE